MSIHPRRRNNETALASTLQRTHEVLRLVFRDLISRPFTVLCTCKYPDGKYSNVFLIRAQSSLMEYVRVGHNDAARRMRTLLFYFHNSSKDFILLEIILKRVKEDKYIFFIALEYKHVLKYKK